MQIATPTERLRMQQYALGSALPDQKMHSFRLARAHAVHCPGRVSEFQRDDTEVLPQHLGSFEVKKPTKQRRTRTQVATLCPHYAVVNTSEPFHSCRHEWHFKTFMTLFPC